MSDFRHFTKSLDLLIISDYTRILNETRTVNICDNQIVAYTFPLKWTDHAPSNESTLASSEITFSEVRRQRASLWCSCIAVVHTTRLTLTFFSVFQKKKSNISALQIQWILATRRQRSSPFQIRPVQTNRIKWCGKVQTLRSSITSKLKGNTWCEPTFDIVHIIAESSNYRRIQRGFQHRYVSGEFTYFIHNLLFKFKFISKRAAQKGLEPNMFLCKMN